MQHLRFYKSKLPFTPRANVVIYFDVTGIGHKLYYHVLNRYYELIVLEFHRGGLEFCYLPKIAEDMDLGKIYRYFNPQASDSEVRPYLDFHDDHDLLNYIVADFDVHHFAPGIIQYMGEDFDGDETYTFSYVPLPEHFGDSPLQLVRQYVQLHGVTEPLFGSYIGEERSAERAPSGAAYRPSMGMAETKLPGYSEERDTDAAVPTVVLSTGYTEVDDVEVMMSEVQMLVERLRRSGVGEIALQRLFTPTQTLSRLHIRYGRIFLPDYNGIEIKMPTLSKAIFFLFLRHPEGINFSYLPDFRPELQHLYELISGRDNMDDIVRSIHNVTDPTLNSINEKCSRIKQAFLREFDDSIARNYYITGERGEVKKILLPREKVIWEMLE